MIFRHLRSFPFTCFTKNLIRQGNEMHNKTSILLTETSEPNMPDSYMWSYALSQNIYRFLYKGDFLAHSSFSVPNPIRASQLLTFSSIFLPPKNAFLLYINTHMFRNLLRPTLLPIVFISHSFEMKHDVWVYMFDCDCVCVFIITITYIRMCHWFCLNVERSVFVCSLVNICNNLPICLSHGVKYAGVKNVHNPTSGDGLHCIALFFS